MLSLDSTGWLAPYIAPFVALSYPTDTPPNVDSFPDAAYYQTGPKDLCLIITCIAIMAVVRDALRLAVCEPFARWRLTTAYEARWVRTTNGAVHAKANGVSNGHGNGHSTPRSRKRDMRKIHRSVMRFAEQGYQAAYYSLIWCLGFYVHLNLPTTISNPTEVWKGYPHMPVAGPLKIYYLTETAFYLHQMLVLNAEAKRKDHWQMMAHHFITVFLMGTSYYYNFTRVGCLIMVLMDFCDIFLPMAKMLRYLEVRQVVCDTLFAWFMLSWFVTRHVLFNFVIRSSLYDLPRLVTYQWDPPSGHFMTSGGYVMFNVCLCTLQILQILWFATICRVAWGVVSGKGASDSRSDDEDDGDMESKDQ